MHSENTLRKPPKWFDQLLAHFFSLYPGFCPSSLTSTEWWYEMGEFSKQSIFDGFKAAARAHKEKPPSCPMIIEYIKPAAKLTRNGPIDAVQNARLLNEPVRPEYVLRDDNPLKSIVDALEKGIYPRTDEEKILLLKTIIKAVSDSGTKEKVVRPYKKGVPSAKIPSRNPDTGGDGGSREPVGEGRSGGDGPREKNASTDPGVYVG
jgi:hypothetical protein